MGMRENPGSGYILPVEDLYPLFTPEQKILFDELLEEWNLDEAVNFCEEHLPGTIPTPESFFVINAEDGDTGDGEMDYGVVYAYFNEDDLYTKTPTPKHDALLKSVGKRAKFHNWTQFG